MKFLAPKIARVHIGVSAAELRRCDAALSPLRIIGGDRVYLEAAVDREAGRRLARRAA